VQEVIDSVKRVTGRTFEVITRGRRAGDPAQLVANPAHANQVLGWKPRFDDLDTIVAHAWTWQSKTSAPATIAGITPNMAT
jgi:UDP-glucose 4-epimerase